VETDLESSTKSAQRIRTNAGLIFNLQRFPSTELRVNWLTLVCCFFFPLSVVAGPPFRTDDPEPVGYHRAEIYLGSQMESASDGLSGTAPHVEINFGALHETQVHLIVPLIINFPAAGRATYGPGDIEVGMKYRFLKETSSAPQIGIFPLVELPTGNAGKNLGAGVMQLVVPLWLQKSWGDWTTYGGGGYAVNGTPDRAGSWVLGWEAEHDFSEFFTLGAELFNTLVPSESRENETVFNIGAMVNFSKSRHLLLSAGKNVVGQGSFFLYAAYQLTP
jgi:hypothetical protein